MTIPSKVFWIILAAIPTLLIAAAALYILHRFLTVRDQLGTWNLAVRDDKGTEGGHGTLTLHAKSWTTHWHASLPLVDFEPKLDQTDNGKMTFDPKAPAVESRGIDGISHPIYRLMLRADKREVNLSVRMQDDYFLTCKVDLDEGVHTRHLMQWILRSDTGELPLTITATRPP